MAYATIKQFSERSGLGVRVVNETVGTGAGTATTIQSFDLDNGNVMQGTYTLKHAPSGSNNLQVLTESTDYSIDTEGGTILTTGTGAGVIGTDTLYATYHHIEKLSGSVVSDFLDNATAQVDLLTGKYWGTGTFKTEYQDGRMQSQYPTTDNPFMADWNKPDQIILKKYPVTKVDQVFLLNKGTQVSKFFNFNSGSSAFVDWTDNVNSSTKAPFTLFATTPQTGDIIYVGSSTPFLGLDVNLSTNGSGTSVIDWEYFNSSGSVWSDLTETDVDSGASVFTSSGKFTWSYPYGWSTTTVNGQTYYWIRGTLSDGYSTDPICATLSIQDSIAKTYEPRDINVRPNGIIDFTSRTVQSGQQNIRIDYWYGMATTPPYIVELTVLIAALQGFIEISGGSFDDATSYTLGSKTVTIGESYVNIREVIDQIRKRIDTILKQIGFRGDLSAI